MVCSCFTSHGTGALHNIDSQMDGAMYRQILEKSFIPSAKRLLNNAGRSNRTTALITGQIYPQMV